MSAEQGSEAAPEIADQQEVQYVPGQLRIVATTWARDSHDLFDYEARHVNLKKKSVMETISVYRVGTEVQFLKEGEEPGEGYEFLAKIVRDADGDYTVQMPDRVTNNSNPKKVWHVVRDMMPTGHPLVEGDVVKLGRHKLRVRQLVKGTGEAGVPTPDLKLEDNSACKVYYGREEEGIDLSTTPCRICLLDGATEEEPLIAPCQCAGSIRFVHLGCLRYWISGRLNFNENAGSGMYFYKQLNCELCRTPYPAYVGDEESQEEPLPLVQVPKTRGPYVVLENMIREPQNPQNPTGPQNTTKGLHVISLADTKMVKLGRGHESDIRIADVSISRCHAMIRLVDGEFLLEDHCSKFGTLVNLKRPTKLSPHSTLAIQIGRTVLSLSQPATMGLQGGQVGPWTRQVTSPSFEQNNEIAAFNANAPPVEPAEVEPPPDDRRNQVLRAYMAAAHHFQNRQHQAAAAQQIMAVAAGLAQHQYRGEDPARVAENLRNFQDLAARMEEEEAAGERQQPPQPQPGQILVPMAYPRREGEEMPPLPGALFVPHHYPQLAYMMQGPGMPGPIGMPMQGVPGHAGQGMPPMAGQMGMPAPVPGPGQGGPGGPGGQGGQGQPGQPAPMPPMAAQIQQQMQQQLQGQMQGQMPGQMQGQMPMQPPMQGGLPGGMQGPIPGVPLMPQQQGPMPGYGMPVYLPPHFNLAGMYPYFDAPGRNEPPAENQNNDGDRERADRMNDE